jgi:hypothetical protein
MKLDTAKNETTFLLTFSGCAVQYSALHYINNRGYSVTSTHSTEKLHENHFKQVMSYIYGSSTPLPDCDVEIRAVTLQMVNAQTEHIHGAKADSLTRLHAE